MSVAESALPGIEADRVGRWLAEHVDGLAGPVEFGLVSGGRSNLTYRLTDATGATYALRRPPTGGVLSTAHDVSREWRFISALAPTAVPVPAAGGLLCRFHGHRRRVLRDGVRRGPGARGQRGRAPGAALLRFLDPSQ